MRNIQWVTAASASDFQTVALDLHLDLPVLAIERPCDPDFDLILAAKGSTAGFTRHFTHRPLTIAVGRK